MAALPHSTSTSRNYQPFRLRPSEVVVEGLPGLLTTENNIKLEDRTTFRTEEVRLNKINLSLKMEEFPFIVPNSKLNKVHPMVKNIFQGLDIPKVPLAGRLVHFQKSWEKNDKGSKHTGYNKGLSDTIQVKSSSTQKLERDPIGQKIKMY